MMTTPMLMLILMLMLQQKTCPLQLGRAPVAQVARSLAGACRTRVTCASTRYSTTTQAMYAQLLRISMLLTWTQCSIFCPTFRISCASFSTSCPSLPPWQGQRL